MKENSHSCPYKDDNEFESTIAAPSFVGAFEATEYQQQQQAQPQQQLACTVTNRSTQQHDQASTLAKNDDDGFMNCGICLENVVEKGRRFALFSNCIHPFCYECALSWHRDNQYRNSLKSSGFDVECQLIYHSCPVCRVESKFIFPSRDYKTGPRKDAFIAQYKQERLGRPCKFFKGEIGTCPFGKECFYAHLSPEGKDLKPIDVKKPKGKSNIQLKSVQEQVEVFDSSDHNDHMHMPTSTEQDGLDEPDFFEIIETQEEVMMPSATMGQGNISYPVGHDHSINMDEFQGTVNELNLQAEGSLKETISTWWGNTTVTTTAEALSSSSTTTLTNQQEYYNDQMMPGNLNTTNLLSSSWGSSAFQVLDRYETQPEHNQQKQTDSLTGTSDLTWLPSLYSTSATNSETTPDNGTDHNALSSDRIDDDTQISWIMDLQTFMD